MRKRERFIVSSILLAIGLLVIQLIPLDFRVFASILFFIITYVVSAWALHEDLQGIEWITVVPFLSFYAISVSLFYFLLPENIFSKIFILGLFGVGMYALYLTANIYAVAKIRTIQLLRAAHAVGLFMTLIVSALLANTIFSYHLPFWANMGLTFAFVFPISYIFLWSLELKQTFDAHTGVQAFALGLLLSELSGILSFLPSSIWWSSIVITTVLYTTLGIEHNKKIGRLFKNTLIEYVSAFVIVMLIFLFSFQWR